MKITSNEAVSARKSLNLSQAAVASKTGIPRNIMSAFEQKKIVLLDEMQESLVAFFDSQGVSIEGQESFNLDATTGAAVPVDQSTKADPDFYIIDGLCVPAGMDEAEAESLLAQLDGIGSSIEVLAEYSCDRGWFEQYSEGCDGKLNKLLVLCATWRQLVLELHGRSARLAESDDTNTIGGRLERAVSDIREAA